MSKKQKTLGFFGFTKSVKHRGNTTKVQIPDDAHETFLVCKYCRKSFRNQQGLTVHIKCIHGDLKKQTSETKIEFDLTEDIAKEVLQEVVEQVAKTVDRRRGKIIATKRTSYNASVKADIINELTLNKVTQEEIGARYKISQGLISKWLKQKDKIFEEAADAHRKLFKKTRKSVKYRELHQRLWEVFFKARSKGHRINFQWLMTKATTIQRELTNDKTATIGKHVIISFLKRRNIHMRAKQRGKKKSKEDKIEPLKKWHATFRERCIRTGFDDNYDTKWGRFLPIQRLNVDQSPLPFVMDVKRTYEHIQPGKGHSHNTWISQPGKLI